MGVSTDNSTVLFRQAARARCRLWALAPLLLAWAQTAQAQLSTDVAALAVKGSLQQPGPTDGLVSDPTIGSVLPYQPKPAVGDNAFITARISNTGTAIIPFIQVRFFENGALINTVSASLLAPGETRNVTSAWVPQNSRDVTLTAIIDPDNEIAETNESNNSVTQIQRVLHKRLTAEQQQVLFNIARNLPPGSWPGLTTEQSQHLSGKADEYLSDYHQYHMLFGTTMDLWYNARDLNSGVYRYEGIGDSATWTGHHLAALAFKYSATQDAGTLEKINQVVDAVDLLIRVSGRFGYIARFAGPKDDPAYQGYYSVYGGGADAGRPGFGTKAFLGTPPYTNLVWLGNSSRDTYDGSVLGLATAYRLVNDQTVRAKIKVIVEAVLDLLAADNWNIKDGQGDSTSMSADVKAAWLLTGAVINPLKYQAAYETAAGAVSTPRGKGATASEYFSNNLTFIRHYLLCTLEYDPRRSARYRAGMMTLWHDVHDQHNAWFAAIYMDATGDLDNSIARPTYEGQIYSFPEPTRWAEPINHIGRTDLQYTVGATTSAPFFEVFTLYPLPIDQRTISDFTWQRPPGRTLDLNFLPIVYPGIDVFAPFLMDYHSRNNPDPVDVAVVNCVASSLTPPVGDMVLLPDPLGANQFIPIPDPPQAGATITLSTKVVNRGAGELQNLTLTLYNGDPTAGGALIASRAIASLSPRQAQTVTNSWRPPGPGTYDLYAKVEPADPLAEQVRANNVFVRRVTVLSSAASDQVAAVNDLAVTNLSADPERIAVGGTMTLSAAVANQGQLDAANVPVRFFDGDPGNGGAVIGNVVIDSIPSGEQRTATITWTASGVKFHRLYAVVDPDNQIAERDESNNSNLKTVMVIAAGTLADPCFPYEEMSEQHQPTFLEYAYRTSDPVPTQTKPQFVFTISPGTSVEPGQVVTFDLSGSYAQGDNLYTTNMNGPIVSFIHDFGDGVQANVPIAQHIYTKPGIYEYANKIHDATGWRWGTWQIITVGNPSCGQSPREIWIPSGTNLMHGWVTTPAGNGPFPVILQYGPYPAGKTDPCDPWVRNGYAMASVSASGRDLSTGTFDLFGQQTRQGGYDAVEWLAAQPWCDGNVGMIGLSGPAVGAMLTASANPPHLKCVVARSSYADLYRDLVSPGGVVNSDTFVNTWIPLLDVTDLAAGGTPDTGQIFFNLINGNVINQLVLQHAADNAGLAAQIALHPYFDDFWNERAIVNYPSPQAAVLFLGNQRDYWPRATVEIQRWIAPSGGRVVSGPGGHVAADLSGWYPGSGGRFLDGETPQWFERYLKGVTNGVDLHPPVLTLSACGGDIAAVFNFARWEQLSALPAPETEPRQLYLRFANGNPVRPAYHSLSTDLPTGDELPTVLNWSPIQGSTSGITAESGKTHVGALQETWESSSLVYETALLEQDLHVNGPATLSFYATPANPVSDMSFVAHVNDVWPDGTSHYISQGFLLATHRVLVEPKNLYLGAGTNRVLIRPYHSHTQGSVQPIVPAQVYRFDVEIWGVHNIFKRGHRLRLALAAEDVAWRVNFEADAAAIVFNDAAHPSVLNLAVLPAEKSRDPFPFGRPQANVTVQNVAFGSGALRAGQPSAITAQIVNSGESALTDVPVQFYDGDPASGGALLGATVVPSLGVGESATVSLSWAPQTAGNHALFVVADPANSITEFCEQDNTASLAVNVQPGGPAPILRIAKDAGQIVISWTAATGFLLESTPDLANAAWLAVSQTPTAVGDQLVVRVPAEPQQQFFRLRQD